MTHQPLLGSAVMIYTRQNDPFSQEHEDVQVTQGHGLSLLQTSKPRVTIYSTTHNQLSEERQGRAGQGKARQGRAGQGRARQGRAGQGRAGQGREPQCGSIRYEARAPMQFSLHWTCGLWRTCGVYKSHAGRSCSLACVYMTWVVTGKAAHLLSALGMGYVCHILRLAPLGMVMLSSLSQVPVNVQGSFSLSRRNSPDTCNLSQGHTCCHKVPHAVTG